MRIVYAMTTITVTPRGLQLRPTRVEKIAGLVRDLDVPLRAVRSVSVVPDGLAAARGIRAPGLAVPGRRKVGTWRGRGVKTFVSVRRGQPALLVELEGVRFDRVLVGSEAAQEYADRLVELGAAAR